MQGIKILISLLILSTSAFAEDKAVEKAAEKATEKPNIVLCRNQNTVRIIRVEKEEGGPHCVARYSKSGSEKEVGRALNFDNCVKIMQNIKINLEKSSWKCKEATNTTITSSTVGE
jgi:hypothetical protein